jgi:hypothetical protein
MSELRIALVAEGPMDYEVIQSALKAVLPNSPFVMTLLQPEETQPKMGAGWCGVLKWCQDVQDRHHGSLDSDPTLVNFDLLIIHLDVDVASKQYADCGNSLVALAQASSFGSLPCVQPCPPVSDTVNSLVNVIESWLGQATPGDRTLLCLPAQSSGTWLAAAVLPLSDPLLTDAECNLTLESKLGQLPKTQRIKKRILEYRQHAPEITAQWSQVKQVCTQAAHFEALVLAKI